ncbi:hypothetical protein MNBD_BACTEROID01-2027 [hydrothermal vent metagenome]|uniref:Gfo/Idh/MocA-like oxidoreductase N-terminal domain-containing protein n=1 Tax=hydrothermal vent metagenome TaxID=652676 RepID=A0A3B0TP46_9ZZZZ
MLNIGIIGKSELLEKQIKELVDYADIRILGKSSVGTKTQSSEYLYSIPEYNRIELIERSDAIFLEDSSLLPFALLKDAIKRNKHIFFADYPGFSHQECSELMKLTDEAGTVVQVKNPFFFNPVIQWVNANISFPFYVEINVVKNNSEENEAFLPEILMMAVKFAKRDPKKIIPTFFKGPANLFSFQNIRFEFDDSSRVNLNYTLSDTDEVFSLKVISNSDIFGVNVLKGTVKAKRIPVNLKNFKPQKEYESFFRSINKKLAPCCGVNDYLALQQTMAEIEKKKSH